MIPPASIRAFTLVFAAATLLLGGCGTPSHTQPGNSKPVFLYSLYYTAEGENRYPPDGSYSEVMKLLSEDFTVRAHRQPITDRTLSDVKVILISNPNDQAVAGFPPPPHISDAEIDVLVRFVERGGGLILQQNQENHNLQFEPMNRLLARFGMQTRADHTDLKVLTFPPDHALLGGLRWAYIIGNTVIIDPAHSARPRAIVTNDLQQKLVSGTRDHPGILLAGAEPGKGRVLVVTDAGWIINNVLNGGEAAGVMIRGEDHDNREIMRRLARWAAGLPVR